MLPSQQRMCTTPLQNPYSAIAKKLCNPWMKIHSMVQEIAKEVKEYVAATPLVQHPILVTPEVQFISLRMPENFPQQWNSLGLPISILVLYVLH